MTRIAWMFALAIAAPCLLLLRADRVAAQSVVVYPPPVTSYYPPPIISYYSPPVVYTPAPQVSYYAPPVSYYGPSVSYYAPPVSYYAPPTTVTTTRYGLFGQPRVTTSYYYPPVYVGR
jgi:hypothetical protein